MADSCRLALRCVRSDAKLRRADIAKSHTDSKLDNVLREILSLQGSLRLAPQEFPDIGQPSKGTLQHLQNKPLHIRQVDAVPPSAICTHDNSRQCQNADGLFSTLSVDPLFGVCEAPVTPLREAAASPEIDLGVSIHMLATSCDTYFWDTYG